MHWIFFYFGAGMLFITSSYIPDTVSDIERAFLSMGLMIAAFLVAIFFKVPSE